MNTLETCSINIYERHFNIKCPPEECASLYESATYLDRKMRNMANTHKVLGLDQLTIITALNIIHDFFNKKNSHAISDIDQRIENLCHDIEIALNASD